MSAALRRRSPGTPSVALATLSAALALGCSDAASTPLRGDGAAVVDAGAQGNPDFGFDDAGTPIDGGFAVSDAGGRGNPDFGFDDAGNPIDGGFAGDAAATDGSPLEEPLSAFCRGMGAVVEVGANGRCAGSVAQDTFRFALCTCEDISLQSNLRVDAFDARLGAYGASTPNGPNVLTDGHVGVNGALDADGMIDVLGSVYVSGGGFRVGQQSSVALNVYARGDAEQPNSSSRVGRSMFIDGDVEGRFQIGQDLHVPVGADVDGRTTFGGRLVRGPLPPVTPCPCAADQRLDVASFVAFGRARNDNASLRVLTSTTWASGAGPDTITLPCGRYYLTQIQHPRSLTIRAEGRTVLYVDGDLTLGGGLRLELARGAELDLFVRGGLSLQAASRLGDASQPSKVRTYVGGSAPITLNASSVFGGNLYAPNAEVRFGASADLYGALFARRAVFSGSASVHFDRAVRSAGEACTSPDAGVRDAGAAPSDAGSIVPDAGAPRDAGPAAPDAGAARDAGSIVPDAATTPDGGAGCSSCNACGSGLACLVEPGQSGGQCGACRTDLDCCLTEICEASTGLCRSSI